MKRDCDFSRIDAKHDAINLRLEEWARWVRYHPQAWKTPAIWNNYRSHAWQWERPEIRIPASSLQAMEVERAVSIIPEKNRTALRWAYVWPFVPVNAVRRELAVTRDGLYELIDHGRSMVSNRLKQRLHTT